MLMRLFKGFQPAARRVGHRPIGRLDAERLRWTGDGSFVMPRANPGIRVEPEFVSEAEVAALAREVEAKALRHGYGYVGDNKVHTLGLDGKLERFGGVVNNTRVTGRLEKPYEDGAAEPPPWGYGDAFDMAEVPPSIRQLADRIATCGDYELGPLRDVTINGRRNSFFQLDPHIDPADDGPDVFILSMGSSVVTVWWLGVRCRRWSCASSHVG
jgi:hypothetical protein